jgi:hypothetical protein
MSSVVMAEAPGGSVCGRAIHILGVGWALSALDNQMQSQ